MPGLERMNRGGQIAERLLGRFTERFSKTFPSLYRVCYDPVGTHRRARATLGFFFGFSLALFFYEVIIVDLEFEQYTSLALGAIVVVMLSSGCASSVQVRCVCLLTLPAFCGRAGRSVLKALVLAYVIAGPIFNLTYNGKEVVRTFACTSQLTYNLSKTRADLMFKPFKEALFGIKNDLNEVKDTLASVRDLTGPIVGEIEGEEEMNRLKEENDYLDEMQDDTKRSEEIEEKERKKEAEAKTDGEKYEARYREKVEHRCQEQLSRGADRCRVGYGSILDRSRRTRLLVIVRSYPYNLMICLTQANTCWDTVNMFGETYNKCYDAVTWIAAWLLCWPMKLTFVCNLAQALGGNSICDPDGKVDIGVGEGYASLKTSRAKLSQSLKDAKLQYKVKFDPAILDVHGASDTAKAVMHDFDARKRLFDSIMKLVKRCLAFVFLKIIVSAQNYHDKYLAEIEHDNIYVTPYFRRIDARRKSRGSTTLLPLKKVEREKLVDPYSGKPSKVERANLLGQTVKLVLEMVTATTFVLLDRLFFETLDLVRRHARIDYTQTGHHDMSLDIRGTGLAATLVRSVIKGFNVKRHVKTAVSNSACLPRPSELSNYVLGKIYGTYLGVWIMLFLAAYTQRTRRVVCSFFYRKREKRRVLYLYNETLRRRLGYFRFMKGKVRALVRARLLERDMDPWVALRLRSPRLCGWLHFFACARQKCLICGDPEPRRGPEFRRCTTPGCPFVHCPECWRDVGRICYACADLPDSDSEEYDTQGEELM